MHSLTFYIELSSKFVGVVLNLPPPPPPLKDNKSGDPWFFFFFLKCQIIVDFIYLFIYLFIYTIFQEGDIFSSMTSLPYMALWTYNW